MEKTQQNIFNDYENWKQSISRRMRRMEMLITITIALLLSNIFYSLRPFKINAITSSSSSSIRMLEETQPQQTHFQHIATQIDKIDEKLNLDTKYRDLRDERIQRTAQISQLAVLEKPANNARRANIFKPKSALSYSRVASKFTRHVQYSDDEKKISNLLLPYTTLESCEGTVFHLLVRLDDHAEETSWKLVNQKTLRETLWKKTQNEDKSIVESQTYGEADNFSTQTFTVCIENEPHVFSLYDSKGNGISCENNSGCYDIYENGELMIQGQEFGSSIHYYMDSSSSYCAVGSTLLLEVKSDLFNVEDFHLYNDASNEEITANFIRDGTRNSTTFFTCLSSGLFTVKYDASENGSLCENDDPCYHTYVNNELILKGNDFVNNAQKSFYITTYGIVRERLCHNLPNLSPINSWSNNIYDKRVGHILDIIHGLSTVAALSDPFSYQYKAACFILHDDVANIDPESTFFVERYSLAAFLYATNQIAELLIPINHCDLAKEGTLECDSRGRITKIDYSNSGIQGIIPLEISHFQDLEILNLDVNRLMGTLPIHFGKLTKLRELHLQSNNLTGFIPSEFGLMRTLSILRLDMNNLEGSLPSEIGNCAGLEILSMQGNKVEGKIPSELFHCTRLKDVNIEANQFTGEIPTNFHHVKHLKGLQLGINNLSGKLPSEIGELSALEWVIISSSRLTGSLPEELGRLRQLKKLIVNNNLLKGTLPDFFDNFTTLDTVDLSQNFFSGVIPDSMWIHSDSLQRSHLQGNLLKGEVPGNFCQKDIDFAFDNSTWFLDEPKVNCMCCDVPVSCYLWDIRKNTKSDSSIPTCPINNIQTIHFFDEYWLRDHFSSLVLHHKEGPVDNYIETCLSPTGCYTLNRFTDIGIKQNQNYSFSASSKSLVDQNQCETVQLCGIDFGLNHPRRQALNHLTQLVLPDVHILDNSSSPEYEALCFILEDESFDDYNICDGTLLQRYVMALFYTHQKQSGYNLVEFANKTCDWPDIKCDSKSNTFIEHLQFPNKGLGGVLLPELGLLKRLQTIDFSGNNFKGVISPLMIVDTSNLREFKIANNKISGEIPDEIFDLPNLKILNVSNNTLAGTLSNDIVYPAFLEIFDVSNNLLIGTIPSALFKCNGLQVLDLSRNTLKGHISTLIGNLHNLKTISIHQNSISGSIPSEIFTASKLEAIYFQSNRLTGSIPSEVATLEHATMIALNHNFLKGNIPSEMKHLKKLRKLHLHSNLLIDIAPEIDFIEEDQENYITDCGVPSYSLVSTVECKSCTMCCNSEGSCQPRFNRYIFSTFIVFASVPVLLTLSGVCFGFCRDDRNPTSIYQKDSTHCLIFSPNRLAWLLYLFPISVQGFVFNIYVGSAPEQEWKKYFKCLANKVECIDLSNISIGAWILWVIVVIIFLGSDIVISYFQIRKSVAKKNFRLFLSGFILFFLSAFAFYANLLYNIIVCDKDMDLLSNTVILLFIIDVDEKFMIFLHYLAPDWISSRLLEIEEIMTEKPKINVSESESIAPAPFYSPQYDNVSNAETKNARIETTDAETLNDTNTSISYKGDEPISRFNSFMKSFPGFDQYF